MKTETGINRPNLKAKAPIAANKPEPTHRHTTKEALDKTHDELAELDAQFSELFPGLDSGQQAALALEMARRVVLKNRIESELSELAEMQEAQARREKAQADLEAAQVEYQRVLREGLTRLKDVRLPARQMFSPDDRAILENRAPVDARPSDRVWRNLDLDTARQLQTCRRRIGQAATDLALLAAPDMPMAERDQPGYSRKDFDPKVLEVARTLNMSRDETL